MRLGFQNIGPGIASLEMFINVEHIVLSGNYIEEISRDSFRTNLRLQFLSLAKNNLKSDVG